MNKRFKLKIQKTSVSSSYVAIVPMKVVKEFGINKGDILEVELTKIYETEIKEKGETE